MWDGRPTPHGIFTRRKVDKYVHIYFVATLIYKEKARQVFQHLSFPSCVSLLFHRTLICSVLSLINFRKSFCNCKRNKPIDLRREVSPRNDFLII